MGGKSRILALIGIYLAIFCDWRRHLSVGEVGTVLILAASKDQARVIFRYVSGMLNNTPMLAKFVKRETADTIELSNGLEIRIVAASFRTSRGTTTIAILADETAFWWNDESAAEQDIEIMRALKPSTLTVPGARIMIASSPYAKRGLLWKEYRRLYGKEAPGELAWQAETTAMNPTVPQSEIDAELEKDREAARAEYLAQFRDDLESYLAREAIDAVVLQGVREIAPKAGIRYVGFVDAAGGSGGDSMTLGIAHYEHENGGLTVLDALREVKPRFSPEAVVSEFAAVLKAYRIVQVHADRWGGAFVAESFQRHGITLKAAEQTKSELYSALLPLINSNKCRLLDHDRAINQLAQLERRVGRGTGRDSIDHPPGGHDDVSNALAGAIVSAKGRQPMRISAEALAASMKPPQLGGGDFRAAAAFARRYGF